MDAPSPDRFGIAPSPELIAVVKRWMRARQRRDVKTLSNLFVASEHLRYIGTDGDELFSGLILRDGYAAHVSEIPAFVAEADLVEAFEAGGVGWASWVGKLLMEERDDPLYIRFSFVLILDEGVWRIAHVHASNPRSNLEAIGRRHFALQSLMDSARDTRADLGAPGLATILFTDVANSTSIAAAIGDRAWTACIGRHFAEAEEIIAAHGGRLVKKTGDGTMSIFRSAHGAVAAAAAIVGSAECAPGAPPLLVRAGLHSGDVIASRDDFYGTVVNKAARIAALAEPGGVLVSSATREMVEGEAEFRFEGTVTLALRGLEGAQAVSRLLLPDRAAA